MTHDILIGFTSGSATFAIWFRDGQAYRWPPIARRHLENCKHEQDRLVRYLIRLGFQARPIWRDADDYR
jgi:hypothetical protein